MSKSLIRSRQLRLIWPYSGFTRVLSFYLKLIEVFAEGKNMTQNAKKRYPFADW